MRWLLPALLGPVLCGFVVVYQQPSLLGRTAPYSDVAWERGVPYVNVDGAWWQLLAIDGRPVEHVAAVSKRLFKTEWRRGFVSAFPALMRASDLPAFGSVTLTLASRDASDRSFVRRVPLTVPNRMAAERAEALRRDVRERAAAASASAAYETARPAAWRHLTRRLDGHQAVHGADWIPADEARLDLDVLEYRLTRRYAYLKRTALDYHAAFDVLRGDLSAGITRRDFGVQLEMLLAAFGDGHTGVSLATGSTRLPFFLRAAEDHVVRVDCHDRIIDADAPVIDAIDGTPIAALRAAAEELVPRGTPQLARDRELRYVTREYGLLRALLGRRPPGERLELRLRGPQGESHRTIEVPAAAASDASCARATRAEILDGNVGRLVLPAMESGTAFRQWLDQAMAWFSHTDGLVIDVRGNSGGDRRPVFALLRHFLPSVTIVNAAALRIDREEDPDLDESYGLEDRFLHPTTAEVFDETDRAAIRRFSSSFRPAWPLPDGEFSKWHYAVVRGDRRLRYSGRVAVLMDGRTFSAAELFVAAMKGLPNVTLVGTASAGGSGFPVSLVLPHSGLTVWYSTMASFQPDGRLFDGNGVQPDVAIEPRLADLVAARDVQLAAALATVAAPSTAHGRPASAGSTAGTGSR